MKKLNLAKLREILARFKKLPVDGALIKVAGSVITCPNGHWLYSLTRNIWAGRGEIMRASDVECIEDTMPTPVAGTNVKIQCSYCGAPWRRVLPNGRAQVHFTTGWWPEFTEEPKC